MTCFSIPLDRKPSFRIWIRNLILTFCGCGMTFFIYFCLLLGIVVVMEMNNPYLFNSTYSILITVVNTTWEHIMAEYTVIVNSLDYTTFQHSMYVYTHTAYWLVDTTWQYIISVYTLIWNLKSSTLSTILFYIFFVIFRKSIWKMNVCYNVGRRSMFHGPYKFVYNIIIIL